MMEINQKLFVFITWKIFKAASLHEEINSSTKPSVGKATTKQWDNLDNDNEMLSVIHEPYEID